MELKATLVGVRVVGSVAEGVTVGDADKRGELFGKHSVGIK